MIMRLNHLEIVDKPLRKNAIALHKLYQTPTINVPSVEDLIIKRISLSKHLNDVLSGLDEFEVNEDLINEDMMLCDFLNIDYDEITPRNYGGDK